MSVLLGRAARHYWCRSRCSSVLGLSGIRQHSPAPLSYTCDQYRWIRVDMSTVGGGRGGADIVAGKRAAAYKAVDECVKVVESRDVCVYACEWHYDITGWTTAWNRQWINNRVCCRSDWSVHQVQTCIVMWQSCANMHCHVQTCIVMWQSSFVLLSLSNSLGVVKKKWKMMYRGHTQAT